ncbi:MAG: alpha/beta hydrolase, partial [Candidatus Micrarchaeaceae archaeon]
MSKENIEGRYVYLKRYDTDAYYEVYGSSSSKLGTIVFVHAAAGDSRLWHDVVILLPDKFKYIMVDLPGHGKSFPVNWKPIYEKNDYVRFLKEFIDTLGIDNFALCGDAIGARISLMYGATMDDKRLKGLILFEPAEFIPGDWYGPVGSLEKDF